MDWLDVQLPDGANELTEDGQNGLILGAKREILLRTYPGTLMYPVLFVVIGLISDHLGPTSVIGASVLGLSVAILPARVAIYRRAMQDLAARRSYAMVHVALGIATAFALSVFACAVFLTTTGGDVALTGLVIALGLGSGVARLASPHKKLAFVWSGVAVIPPTLTLLSTGGAAGYGLGLLFVAYFVVMLAGIKSEHDAYWRAQVSAILLEERAQQTVALSRYAGMAEIATNVLHDVGNTLNSVKTTLAGLIELHQRDPVTDLERIVGLLDQHADDLATFLTDDPRGRRLPAFVEAVTAEAVLRRAEVGQALQRLRAHTDHIEVVVARQQDIAKGGDEHKAESLPQLVADALELLGLRALKPQAGLELRIPELLARVDRHRTLQVLVNLIKNALDAVADTPVPHVLIEAHHDDDEFVVLTISDNGCGADSQVVERVFSRGFTTKPHGHGFGLHSAFAIVKAMEGSLGFRSEGPGLGATAELRLPAAAKPAKAA